MTIFKFKFITYEERLVIFNNWLHNTFIFEIMIVASWYHCSTKRWLDLIKCTHCIAIVTFRINFEKEEDFLDIHFKISNFCSLALKTLKTLKKQQEKTSTSTSNYFASKLLLNHNFCSSQNFFVMTFSNKLIIYEKRLIIFKKWSHISFIFEIMIVASWYHCSTKKQQEENELEALQIASSKSISIAKSRASRASFYTFLSTILFAKTFESSIVDTSFVFSFTFSHVQSLLNFSYEERLINFKAWSHQLSIFTSLTTIDFCYETNIKDFITLTTIDFCYETNIKNLITCSKCDLVLTNWKSKKDSLRAHIRQSSNCFFAQALSKDQSIVEIFESIIFSITSLQTSLKEISLLVSNSSKTSFLQSISSLLDIDENFVSKSSTQLKIFSSQAQDFQQSSNISKSSFSQFISFNWTSMKLYFELVTQSTSQLTIEETIETSKFEICVNDIDFFDSTMQLNFLEFHLFNINVNFLQNLDAIKYKEQSILTILIKCLRDSIYKWFKTQLDFISLNNFKEVLIVAFSFFTFSSQISIASIDATTIITSHSSSQYHNCFECFVSFSSISRLLTHTQKTSCFKLACKHCEKIFNSNNKFHEHVRLKHTRKSINFVTFVNSFASSTSRASFKTSQSSILIFKTSQTSTFDAFSTSSFTLLVVSRKFVETLKHRLKKKKSKHVNLSFTFFTTSFNTSTKSTILTILITSRLSRLSRLVQLLATFFVNFFASRASFHASHRRFYFQKRCLRSYCKLLLYHLLHSRIRQIYDINRSIMSQNVFSSNFTWSSMIFTSCFMRSHSKRAWLSYKREYFLQCLIKFVSLTISNSLHWHFQSIAFANLLRFRHHNQLELYSIESQKFLIWRSMKLQT